VLRLREPKWRVKGRLDAVGRPFPFYFAGLLLAPAAAAWAIGLSSDVSGFTPSREIPSLYMMSNSASRNGGGDLVLHDLHRGCDCPARSPSLIAAMRRMSMRTEE
jgi:hypothetical protein